MTVLFYELSRRSRPLGSYVSQYNRHRLSLIAALKGSEFVAHRVQVIELQRSTSEHTHLSARMGNNPLLDLSNPHRTDCRRVVRMRNRVAFLPVTLDEHPFGKDHIGIAPGVQ